MTTLRFAGLAALLLAWMPAHAADLGVAPVYKAPAVVPVTTWTGSYIGIAGGGVWGRGLVTSGTTGFNETPRFDVNGGIFGITSGFNYQAGSWVLGYESDTSITSVKGRSFEIAPFTPTFSNELKEPWLSTYRARLSVMPPTAGCFTQPPARRWLESSRMPSEPAARRRSASATGSTAGALAVGSR